MIRNFIAIVMLVLLSGSLAESISVPKDAGSDLAVRSSPTPVQGVDRASVPGDVERHHLSREVQVLVESYGPQSLLDHVEDFARGGAEQEEYYLNEFDENETLSFAYNAGDVDGDGFDDFFWDVLCVNSEGCEVPPPCSDVLRDCIPPNIHLEGDAWCRTPHRLFLISGVNGTEVWRRDISAKRERLPLGPGGLQESQGCATELVVGLLPSPDGGESLLVYRFGTSSDGDSRGPSGHSFYLVDRFSGGVLWRTPVYEVRCILNITCVNLFVNPILQVPPKAGARLIPPITQPALFLQSVGFRQLSIAHPVPGFQEASGRTLLEEYQPIERAVRIDLATGKELWNEPTFQPNERGPDISLVPWAMPGEMPLLLPELRGPYGDLRAGMRWYWNHVPCCFDLTGDHVPDMVYTSMEWYNKPEFNEPGPFQQTWRLYAFDGVSGKRLWETVLDPEAPRYMTDETQEGIGTIIRFELVGDVNADGRSDILVHRLYHDFDPNDVIGVFDGSTGQKLWESDSPRRIKPLPMGNVDGEPGIDVLLVDWFEWQHIGRLQYDYNNLTARPLLLLNGATGDVRWRATTFSAPTDLVFLVRSYRLNGVPDLDGDGGGEFPADDLVVLPDLTVVHRWRFLGGAHGNPVRSITTVGQFSIPGVANERRDQSDDLAIVSGDLSDLWLSLYEGESGSASWSRRLLTPPMSEYVSLQPRLRTVAAMAPGGKSYTMVNFHLSFVSCGGFFCVESTIPQAASYATQDGASSWAYPRFWDPNVTYRIRGPTPASAAFELLLLEEATRVGLAAAVAKEPGDILPGFALFSVVFIAFLGLGRQRWWKQ